MKDDKAVTEDGMTVFLKRAVRFLNTNPRSTFREIMVSCKVPEEKRSLLYYYLTREGYQPIRVWEKRSGRKR